MSRPRIGSAPSLRNDPRSRQTQSGGVDASMIVAPLRVFGDRLGLDIDRQSPLVTRAQGTLDINLGPGIQVTTGSPPRIGIKGSDSIVADAQGVLHARPDVGSVRGLNRELANTWKRTDLNKPGGVAGVDATTGTISAAVLASNLRTVNRTVPAGNTVANTAAETAFTTTDTIAANDMVAGRIYRLSMFGTYSTNAAAPTLRIKVKFGTTVALDTGNKTLVAGLTDVGWSFDGLVVIGAIGAAGSLEVQGKILLDGTQYNVANTAAITVDTTAAQIVSATADWDAAQPDNTVTLRIFALEQVG